MSDQELKELKLRTEIEEGIHQSLETLLEAVKINPEHLQLEDDSRVWQYRHLTK